MRHTRLLAAASFSLAIGYSLGFGRRAKCMHAIEAYDGCQGTVQELAALVYDGPTLENSDRLRQLNDEALERLVAAERKTALCLGRRLKPNGPGDFSGHTKAGTRFRMATGQPRFGLVAG